MPHRARQRGASGYYHVVPKGIGDQLLFLDDKDRALYLELLDKAAAENEMHTIAYCLMSNHVHLVLEDPNMRLSEAMKALHERYAMYFANRTGRTGGIFRKPYWSEPIESENYLLCAVRYVHANPAAAGIAPASAYEWSSAKDYLGREGIADTRLVLDLLGGREGFIAFSKAEHSTAHPFPGSHLRAHLLDEEAARLAKEVLGFDATALQRLDAKSRKPHIKELLARGFPVAQLVRISGLGRYEVERWCPSAR